jgi:hypothetical protein
MLGNACLPGFWHVVHLSEGSQRHPVKSQRAELADELATISLRTANPPRRFKSVERRSRIPRTFLPETVQDEHGDNPS